MNDNENNDFMNIKPQDDTSTMNNEQQLNNNKPLVEKVVEVPIEESTVESGVEASVEEPSPLPSAEDMTPLPPVDNINRLNNNVKKKSFISKYGVFILVGVTLVVIAVLLVFVGGKN